MLGKPSYLVSYKGEDTIIISSFTLESSELNEYNNADKPRDRSLYLATP